MDGFESDKKVVVIAATNRPEMLDSALLRAGRFSRKVFVREPDEDGRNKIISVHFRDVPLEDEDRNDVFDLVASLTPGLVGANLANIANEATLLATRKGAVCVSKDDIMEAIERTKVTFDSRQQHQEFSEQEAQEIYSMSSRLFAHSKSTFVGIFCVVFGVIMYASPLTVMFKVVKTKSVEFMPFTLSLNGFLNGCCWSTYALLKFDLFILVNTHL